MVRQCRDYRADCGRPGSKDEADRPHKVAVGLASQGVDFCVQIATQRFNLPIQGVEAKLEAGETLRRLLEGAFEVGHAHF